MNRPIYTRFSKIISTDEIHPSYIKEIKKEQKLHYFFGEGPATEAFYRNFFKILTIGTEYIVYPVRIANVYILKSSKSSTIFSSNVKLFEKLVKLGLIPENQELLELFRNYQQLDFDKIAESIDNENVKSISSPIWEYMYNEDDVFEATIFPEDIGSKLWVIPCLFEEKSLIEVSIRTHMLSSDIEQKLKNSGFKKTKEAFFLTADAISEIVARWDINF